MAFPDHTFSLGVPFLDSMLNHITEAFIYPVVVRTIAMKEVGLSLQDRLKVFPWILSDLIFPFMMEYMMVGLI